jgi:hypothetical protein
MRESAEGFRFALDPETYGSQQPEDMWDAVERIACPMLIPRTKYALNKRCRSDGRSLRR